MLDRRTPLQLFTVKIKLSKQPKGIKFLVDTILQTRTDHFRQSFSGVWFLCVSVKPFCDVLSLGRRNTICIKLERHFCSEKAQNDSWQFGVTMYKLPGLSALLLFLTVVGVY